MVDTQPEEGDRYQPLGRAVLAGSAGRSARFRCGDATVDVAALAADLFRVGMFPGGMPPGYRSEAVAREDWDPVDVDTTSSADGTVSLTTPEVTVRVSLDPFRLRFEDASGRVLVEDDPALGMGTVPRPPGDNPFAQVLGPGVRVYKRRQPGERYFGCGERTGGLEKTHSRQTFWNLDPPIGHTASHDNLYTSIPFLLTLCDGRAWGLFFDNSGYAELDLALEAEDRFWFGASCAPLIYYVFCGPTIRSVLDRYTELTGRTPMPPLWALGNQQSRYSYMSAEEVRQVAREFRRRDIPCDVLYLDIHYMDGFRVFTWDRERFPEPRALLSELEAEGFRVVTIVDPGVKVDEGYPVYLEGRERDFFCKTSHNREYHNAVWPGVCAFPDFTNPGAREWWGDLHRRLLDDGVAGIWCDMDEPSLFVPLSSTMPPDVVQPGGGEPHLHVQVHNLYGSLMARATREGLLRLQPDRRPFVISRAGFAGLQRHALQWTGDNSSWWEHLAMSVPQLQNMGLSGVAWSGTDIGGFFGDTTGELLARWTELGIFQPLCRNHSEINSRRQEPWLFGPEVEDAIRRMLRLRQRLIPYLYSLFDECHRTGAPIFRPLLFDYPDDETAYSRDDELLLGSALLVAPITRHGTEHRHVYLPEGEWCHFWSGERHEGPCHILAHAPVGEPAIYLRANTPLPLWPEMAHVGERTPDPLTLLVFAGDGPGAPLDLFEDAGDGFDYRRGEYSRRRVTCERTLSGISVHLSSRDGAFRPQRERIVLEVRGLPRSVRAAVDGQAVDVVRTESGGAGVELQELPEAQTVEFTYPEV